MQDLVERSQSGDLEAFGLLIERFQDAVYGTAYALLGDFHDAQDMVQEAFLRAWTKLSLLHDPVRFPGWLCRLTRNCCLDLLRRRRTGTFPLDGGTPPASDTPSAPEKLERAEIQQQVLGAIRSLSEPNRLATTLFYIDGYSTEEVADFLDVPSGTVRRRLHDSRKRLKERMVAMVADELKAAKPGPEGRKAVLAELTARRARFEGRLGEGLPDGQAWADRWHRLRMVDVRANAAQYGIEPDEELPRMLPDRWASETFRNDFAEMARLWGIPEGLQVVLMRELCRALSVTPLALHRWEADGLPVIRFHPWIVYDPERVREWMAGRKVSADERMTEAEAREPLLLTLRALAEERATIAECRHVLRGLETSTLYHFYGDGPLESVWEEEWLARRPTELAANAAQYGLAEPADTRFAVPAEVVPRVHEIRDLTRRLGVSPFDVIDWTHAGMPCLRRSPEVRWDIERVGEWLAARGELPRREYTPAELDDLDEFVLDAVSSRTVAPQLGRELFTVWFGLM